jgi:hypothetical protein
VVDLLLLVNLDMFYRLFTQIQILHVLKQLPRNLSLSHGDSPYLMFVYCRQLVGDVHCQASSSRVAGYDSSSLPHCKRRQWTGFGTVSGHLIPAAPVFHSECHLMRGLFKLPSHLRNIVLFVSNLHKPTSCQVNSLTFHCRQLWQSPSY